MNRQHSSLVEVDSSNDEDNIDSISIKSAQIVENSDPEIGNKSQRFKSARNQDT